MDQVKKKDNTVTPLVILVVMIIIAYLSGKSSVELGPGVKVEEAPYQSETLEPSFESGDYHIKPIADFDCKAKIIGRKTYSDEWSDVCPIDLTLGWQNLSDESFIRYISFTQHSRWTYFKFKSLPEGSSMKDIITQHGNFHMCPADDEVKSKLLNAPVGSIIHFKGHLITLHHNTTGWSATSSTSRSDTKGGACEIVWVTELSILPM